MRYAISVPNYGDFADPAVTIALAHDIEAAGWDAFFLWDHVLVRNGNVVADPWALLAAIAVSTERIRLGTMVTPLPRRRPWQVVRQIVTLDHLSSGRAVLGVGIGYPPKQEYEVFGESGDERVRAELLDEGLDVVTGLMSGRPFSYEGRHFHLDGVEFAPQPVQRPRVPIWVAGTWPYRKPFRRAARYDGVVPIARDANEDEILVDVAAMREIVAYTDEHRTDDGPFDRVFTGYLPEDKTEARAIADELASFGVNWWQAGPGPDEPLDAVRSWIRLGPPT